MKRDLPKPTSGIKCAPSEKGFPNHHAGSNFFGGGCYLNGAAIAIHELQEKLRSEVITDRELKSLIGMLNSASQLDARYGKLSKIVGRNRVSPPNNGN